MEHIVLCQFFCRFYNTCYWHLLLSEKVLFYVRIYSKKTHKSNIIDFLKNIIIGLFY